MKLTVYQEPSLVSRLRQSGIDFFAIYLEEAQKAGRDDRFVTFDEIYGELSSRVLAAMLEVEPAKREVETFRCERVEVYDALESFRLLCASRPRPDEDDGDPDAPLLVPRTRGGGFSCMS